MSDPTATVLDLDLAAWNKVFATNVGGAFLMSRWVIPHMLAAGEASLLEIARGLQPRVALQGGAELVDDLAPEAEAGTRRGGRLSAHRVTVEVGVVRS